MTIQKVINKGLCLGCGICTYDESLKGMMYSKSKGINIPILEKNKEYRTANQICPASGYSIVKKGRSLYNGNKISVELGFYDKLFAGHSYNQKILANASSGGVMPEILIYLLNNKIVDKVAVTKFVYTKNGPQATTFLTNNIDEIFNSQGSKYCPVDVSEAINKIKKEDGKIAYLGTPCQIAGIRKIQNIDPHFKEKIILTISNFCGGYKSFNHIKKISKRHSIDYKNISFLRFRGGGQPGGMLIDDKKGNRFEALYPKYGGFTGHAKLLRCHLCVDATGELADIACGDAWIEEYINDTFPWSVILTRSAAATNIIQNMGINKIIKLNSLSEEEVCLSQKQNIISKKVRQFSRFKFYHALGYCIPVFDGGYYKNPTPLKTEAIVYLMHRFKEILEKVGLYKCFRILNRREY